MTQVAQGSSEGAELAIASAAAGGRPSRKGLAELVEQNMAEIERALPADIMKPERFARIIMTEFRKTPKLLLCTPESFLGALFQVAQLGLEPGGQLGHAFLIPYDNSRMQCTEAQLQIGYKGFVELGGRRGILMRAREVRKGDRFDFDLGSNEYLHHDWKLEENSSRLTQPVIGYWGKVVMPDGKVTFTVMDKSEINARRDRSAAVRSGKKTPWGTDYDAMARKTVIRAMVPQVALAPDLQVALRADEAVIRREATGDLSYLYRDAIDTTAQIGGTSSGKEDVTNALNAMENNQERLRCSKYLFDNYGSIENLADESAPALLKIITEWPAVLDRDTTPAKAPEGGTGELFGDETEAIFNELDDELRAAAREHLEGWRSIQDDQPSDDASSLELERWLAEPQGTVETTPQAAQEPAVAPPATDEAPPPTDPQEGPTTAQRAQAQAVGVSDELLASTKLAIDSWDAETCKRILREWGQPVAGKVEVLRLRLLEVLAPARAAENPMAVNLF